MGLFDRKPTPSEAVFPAIQDLRDAAQQLAEAAAKLNKLADALLNKGLEVTIRAKEH